MATVTPVCLAFFHRQSLIQELTKGHRWNLVEGIDNSADLMPKDLIQQQHWFQEPH